MSTERGILQNVRRFTEEFYKNKIIVTCRINSQGYLFRNFSYLEIADFNEDQIASFAKNYFVASVRETHKHIEKEAQSTIAKNLGESEDIPTLELIEKLEESDRVIEGCSEAIRSLITDYEQALIRAHQFLSDLDQPLNYPIRDLLVTPILLSLACAVYRHKNKFYSKVSKLYEEAFNLLLNEWDTSRGIERDSTYWDMSRLRKERLLCYIAAIKFEQKQHILYEESEIKHYIDAFLEAANREPRWNWCPVK